MQIIEIEKYKAWLSSTDENHKVTAICVLWHAAIRDKEIDDIMIHILRTDDNNKARRNAIRMVSETGDRKFRKIFIELLEDQDWLVRGHAFLGLKKVDSNYSEISEVLNYINKEMHPFCRYCIG